MSNDITESDISTNNEIQELAPDDGNVTTKMETNCETTINRIEEDGKALDDSKNLKKEQVSDHEEQGTDFDAFSDGVNIHRKYSLRRSVKPVIKDSEETEGLKKELTFKNWHHSKYTCTHCPKVFDSKSGILNHLRKHQRVRQFVCALCQENFTSNELLIEHKIEHKGEDKVFLCKICKMAFTDHCDFLVHEVTHSQRSSFKCIECGTWQTRSYIKRHIQSHFDCRVECDECNNFFKNDGILRHHKATVHVVNMLECVECGKLLKNTRAYEAHLSTHTGLKKYQCLYCGKGFSHNGGREVHTRLHTNERPFKCDICDKEFYQQTDMQRHRLRHDKERSKFKCQSCNKQYKNLHSLRQHEKLHNQENLYYCPVCSNPYQNKQVLRIHMQHKHSTSKEFKCEYCNLEFKTKSCLSKHNRSKIHQRVMYGVKMIKSEHKNTKTK